jgi:hypothetical protein
VPLNVTNSILTPAFRMLYACSPSGSESCSRKVMHFHEELLPP